MNIRPPRIGPQPWDVVRTKLDQSLPFANMRDTPYYRDAVYEQVLTCGWNANAITAVAAIAVNVPRPISSPTTSICSRR